ncbi:LOB domain-containing protein 41 [Physcomitrium patens]|uniref:LOB domain-containing protein n=1 Tax=Physcomitrium patens TaxID=3218 RepID=A0A2K1K483_PHYPA|nr:LOB domain-containing protein 41-like [Physcomitrium patens]XP_024384916.1 LOB domain-containing protein 41-like [Physcomitrium patens]XP_024384917.1 LOB domain-containing protein 41-like [Physcomitrium patens]PNR48585.1 hypothetical protein PHYPA_013062 [Physcomitrium patens]|eukprot:XP_024384915.1 LOB domain-containing protein 41-like [Physcomitrella patens]
MSCDGCRVLRKGCSDTCILRHCLQWIESADAQGHATVFVAKFFGRAGLMGFISAVHETERPALFQSLLYEACGRTVNPVFGAVGLLSGGNWQACQTAVETVLKGGTLRPPSTTSLSSCLPANQSSNKVLFPAFNAFPKFTTPLPVRGDDDAQGASTPPSRSVTEPVPERENNGLGVASSLPRSRDLEKYVDGGLDAAMKGWHEESVRRQNVNQMLSWPSGINYSRDIKNHTPKDLYERRMFKPKELGFLDLYGTHAVCPSPRRVKARVDFSLVNPSGLQEAAREHLITTPRADQLELDLTLTVKGAKAGQIVGSKRVSSPSESVNSEGSVTTLDSTPRHHSRISAWTTKMDHVTPPFSKLLPLLQ